MSCVVASSIASSVRSVDHPYRLARGALSTRQLRIAQHHLSSEVSIRSALFSAISACGVSRSHFTRAFKVSTGLTPSRWHLEARMRTALDLLRGNESIAGIAVTLGFCDQSHFANAFGRLFRISPGAYRKRLGISLVGGEP